MGAENISVAVMATLCKDLGHSVKVAFDRALFDDKQYFSIDFLANLFDKKKQVIEEIIKEKPDVLAMSVFSDNYQWSLDLVRRVKEKHKNFVTVWGGIHPTSVPGEVIKEDAVDFVIEGDGELPMTKLLHALENGKVLEGPSDVNTAGFIIHSAVHLNHPKNKFVFHAHPPMALAATALKDGIPHLVQDSSMLYGKVGYHDWEGLSVDKDERFRIAENLGENKVLIMRNHGLLTVGETAGESFMNMYYAIRMCEVAVQAQGSGLKLEGATKTLWEKSQEQYDAFSPGPNEWPALLRRCEVTDPSYKE